MDKTHLSLPLLLPASESNLWEVLTKNIQFPCQTPDFHRYMPFYSDLPASHTPKDSGISMRAPDVS